MSHRRGACSLGDFVRSVHRLELREETDLERLAGLLGLPALPAPPAPARSSDESPPVVPPRVAAPVSNANAGRQDSTVRRSPAPDLDDRNVPATPARPQELPRLADARRPPRVIASLESLLTAPVAPPVDADMALFAARAQRGIVATMVSARSRSGPVDIDRLLADLTAGRAVERLPLTPIYSTRKGLQVLVDVGSGMQPFARDVIDLERLLRDTAGRDGVELLRFDRAVASGVGAGSRRTWGAYRPPSPGTPVVVVSDFGLADLSLDAASAIEQWAPVVTAGAAAGCPLLALTPFPDRRWPDWLSRSFVVIAWDRRTTAAAARRGVERAARGRRNG